MTANRPSPLSTGGIRVGAVLVVLAGIAGGTILLQSSSHADAPAFTLTANAIFAKKDQLQVGVTVAQESAQQLNGSLEVELVDARGKVVQTAKQKIDQKDARAAYRFEFKTTQAQSGKLKVRTRFQKKHLFPSDASFSARHF